MNDCIFCKIAAGQIKTQLVYEDDQVVAFRDLSPQAPVHILIIPRKHIERVSEAAEADMYVFWV
jgi:histidine triad (HIT) family protein